MRAILVQHEEHEGEGLFGPPLVQRGFELVHRFRSVQPGDADAELVVVLGGGMGAYDTASHPFLRAELALLQQRLQRGAPCLGICLGAQLLAMAAGAGVGRGGNGLEIGALPVHWTAAAQQDAVLAAPAAAMVVAHWHQDTFDPVPGAELLASTERYAQQGFRLGASYAFQFHLELTARDLQAWLRAGRAELAAAGHDVAALRAGAAALAPGEPARLALVERLAAHFAAVARRRPRA